MSRLTDLLGRVEDVSPELAKDLQGEVKSLSARLEFGLNFERHIPELVRLPGREIRRGDKVVFLAPRDDPGATVDERTWIVTNLTGRGKRRAAELVERNGMNAEPESATRTLEDLVVVAEFRDPIYPGLRSTGKVERGGDKPWHVVVNGENFHALEALVFAYEGGVDCIYIDPPYNTRAKDWKYNNDYVDPDDDYAHSKWLAFMERRLRVAKKLLNPDRSCLIVTIDEKEYLRLGLLLEQTFPGARIQMITSVISAKGAVRPGRFSRVEEHIFFVLLGDARVDPWTHNMLNGDEEDEAPQGDEEEAQPAEEEPQEQIEWLGLRRREPSSIRGARPNQFFPIFVDAETGLLQSVGDAIDDNVKRSTIKAPKGIVALWPLKPDGTEMLWGLTPEALRKNWAEGFARVNNWKPDQKKGTVQYLPSGTIQQIRSGEIIVTGRRADGSVEGARAADSEASTPPKKVWHMRSHNAETGGTKVLTALIPGRRFDYPKSLYAVEDALRFVVGRNRDAVILDFFAGSGTTAHAVMRLNRQDSGRRRSIMITNNEVSAEETLRLRKAGHRPGDSAWEALGICEYITKPRVSAAVTGQTVQGKPVDGRYTFTDEFPMADGLDENVEFFDLSYQDPELVRHGLAFTPVDPLLWLRAGSRGARIEEQRDGFALAESYAVLFEIDAAAAFVEAVRSADELTVAYVVTDEEKQFQIVADQLPRRIEPVRLYESYLRTFRINTGEE